MKMEYKLLNGNSGVIMTRTPELVSDMLYISFAGAPDKATAIFERSDGESAYKALSDGLCGIESDWLNGSTKVTVAVLDGSAPRPQRDVVAANAGLALSLTRPDLSLADCIATAREVLESGAALRTFRRFVELNS